MPYLPRMGISPYGGAYGGGMYGGSLPEMSFQPTGLTQAEEGLTQTEAALQDQAMLPARAEDEREQFELRRAGYGNSMLAQIAEEANRADPADAPGVWDRGMQRLADEGVDGAAQYIGNYRQDLAERVGDIASGRAQAQKNASLVDSGTFDTQAAYGAIAKLTPAQRAQTLGRYNAMIEGFNAVHDEASWNDELGKLRQMGIPVDQLFPKSADWRLNFGLAHNLLQSITPIRNIIADQVMSETLGGPAPMPLSPYGARGAAEVYIGTTADGRPIMQNKMSGQTTVDGVPYEGPVGAKPSAGRALFDDKYQSALGLGWSENDALAFAGGKKAPSDAEIHNMAATRANQELGDVTMAGQTIADPTAYVNQREEYWYNLLKSGAGGAGAGAPGRQPQRGGSAAAPQKQAPANWSDMNQQDRDLTMSRARAYINKNKGSPQARAYVVRTLRSVGAPTAGF